MVTNNDDDANNDEDDWWDDDDDNAKFYDKDIIQIHLRERRVEVWELSTSLGWSAYLIFLSM